MPKVANLCIFIPYLSKYKAFRTSLTPGKCMMLLRYKLQYTKTNS